MFSSSSSHSAPAPSGRFVAAAPRYLIFDRDAIFSAAVVEFIKAMGTKPVRISYRSPWQNGTAERWIGSCRREVLVPRTDFFADL